MTTSTTAGAGLEAVPPQNLDAEESVLGAFMLSGGAIDACRDKVAASDFYRVSHGRIFATAVSMRERGDPVDAITLSAELERKGWLEDVGGRMRLQELAAIVPAAANAPHYATLVRRAAIARETIRVSTLIRDAAHNGGISDHVDLVDKLQTLAVSSEGRPKLTLSVNTAKEVAAWPDPEQGDLLLGDLVIRGGRTLVLGDSGHGKTSLVLQMVAAIVDGEDFLKWRGSGGADSSALLVDLEQGRKSIKRAIRDANLDGHERVHVVSNPDGLALDSNPDDFAALENAIASVSPDVLVLDPYFKAHRVDDPNAERPVAELMRKLDALRVRYGFALILPVHPRKQQGKDHVGARKLTLDDVAGSGVIGRAVEVGIAIERLSHGYARLRYLKDREGELPTGDDIALVYRKGEGGFVIDPKVAVDDEVVERQILDKLNEGTLWTAKEWGSYLNIREGDARSRLESMADAGVLSVVVAPPGRSRRARCYGTQFELDTQSSAQNFASEGAPENDEYPF